MPGDLAPPILSIRGLTKRYGDRLALDGLTLDVPRGAVSGFLGHNGAGKTTTLNMLVTLSRPTSGTASVAGHDLVGDPMAVRRVIGYVPENVRLYDTMTARENLLFFARLSGLEDPEGSVEDTLRLLGGSEYADRRVGTFSKGMRQRVGLAQGILHRPPLLFLDEPASGLDPQGMSMLRELILRLNGELGVTIFMNTRLIGETAKTCTRIAVLNHGRLVHEEDIDRLAERYVDEASLEALYLGIGAPRPGETIRAGTE